MGNFEVCPELVLIKADYQHLMDEAADLITQIIRDASSFYCQLTFKSYPMIIIKGCLPFHILGHAKLGRLSLEQVEGKLNNIESTQLDSTCGQNMYPLTQGSLIQPP